MLSSGTQNHSKVNYHRLERRFSFLQRRVSFHPDLFLFLARVYCKFHWFLYLPIFSVKRVRFFVSTEPEFPKIYRRLQKIAEDFRHLLKISRGFPKIAEDFATIFQDNRRCQKIFNDIKTEPTISKGFPTNLEHY